MEQATLTGIKSETLLEKFVTDYILKKDYESVKANLDGYDTPVAFANKSTGDQFIPDVVATKNGRKNYFELAIKNEMKNKTINKWKLLSTVAQMKRGRLVLVAPHGNYAFTEKLCNQYNIEAKIMKF